MGVLDKFIKKVVGVKVELKLNQHTFIQGDVIAGEVHISGNSRDIELEDIHIEIRSNAEVVGKNEMREINTGNYKIKVEKRVQKGTLLVYPFQYRLDKGIPFTSMKSKSYIEVGLVIQGDTEWYAKQEIVINASNGVRNIIEAFTSEKFELIEVENKWYPEEDDEDYGPLCQQLEFRPSLGFFSENLAEVEVEYESTDDGDEFCIELTFETHRDKEYRYEMWFTIPELNDDAFVKSALNDAALDAFGRNLNGQTK